MLGAAGTALCFSKESSGCPHAPVPTLAFPSHSGTLADAVRFPWGDAGAGDPFSFLVCPWIWAVSPWPPAEICILPFLLLTLGLSQERQNLPGNTKLSEGGLPSPQSRRGQAKIKAFDIQTKEKQPFHGTGIL